MKCAWKRHLQGAVIAVAVVGIVGLIGASATLFFEDFENPAEGWLEGPDPQGNGEWSFSEDSYRVLVTRPEATSRSSVPEDSSFDEFCVEVNSRVLSNRPGEIGLLFGAQDGSEGSNGLTFATFPDGAYRLGRLDDGSVENLSVTTAPRTLQSAGTFNTLQVVVEEDRLQFRANGETLADANRGDVSVDPGGEIALFGRSLGEPLAQGEFDAIRIMTPDCEP